MEIMTGNVKGITCGGCASVLRAAVGAVEGVIDVDVDAVTGEIVVRSDRDVRLAVAVAVADAGYEVV